MAKKKSLKAALFTAILSLIVCISMFAGTTFAWFTDSVTSSGNIIASGTLDAEMYWAAGTTDLDSATWNDASTSKIFNNSKWEPGYTEAKHIKIVNNGSLAFKYELIIVPNGTVSELANVIDVYYIDGGAQVENRDDIDESTKVGTLADLINDGIRADALEAGENHIVTLVLAMNGEAGNEYQNLSIGTDFAIKLAATQYTYEKDSFDDQYDKDAPFSVWNGNIPSEMPSTLVVAPATRTITVNDAAAFAYLNTLRENWVAFYSDGQGTEYSNYMVENGGKGVDYYYGWTWDVKLNCDIDLANKPWTPINLSGFRAVDGQNHTVKNIAITVNDGSKDVGLFADVRGGISNINVDNVSVNAGNSNSVGAVAGNANGVISNVKVKSAIVTGKKYVGGIIGYGYASIVNSSVSDSVISISAAGEKEAGGLAGYLCTTTEEEVKSNVVKNTVISAPTVASALVSQPNGLYDISNNKVEGVTVTTEDGTADIFVSNNVDQKSTVIANTETNCTVNKEGALTKIEFVSTLSEAKTALANGANYIDAQGANLGAFNYVLSKNNVLAGTTVTIKNAVVEGESYGNGVNGTVVFENCTFTNTGAYSIHFDSGSGNVVFNNCVLDGWCSFGKAIKSVTMNDCTFFGNGTYAMIRFYQNVTMTNCVIDVSNTNTEDIYADGIDVMEGYTATMINCTNVNGSVAALFEAEDIAGTDGIVIIK